MAGLKFSSFGAATMPLSKIVVDATLDLTPYEVIAKYAKAAYDPSNWQTTTIPWPSDTTPSELASGSVAPTGMETLTWTNGSAKPVEVYGEITNTGYGTTTGYLLINDVTVRTFGPIPVGETAYSLPVWVNPGEVVKVRNDGGKGIATGKIHDTGRRGPPETIDLSGAWITLDIDWMGLTATLSILGEDVTYADYALYFPIKPDSLEITGTLAPTQDRPVIRGYLW